MNFKNYENFRSKSENNFLSQVYTMSNVIKVLSMKKPSQKLLSDVYRSHLKKLGVNWLDIRRHSTRPNILKDYKKHEKDMMRQTMNRMNKLEKDARKMIKK